MRGSAVTEFAPSCSSYHVASPYGIVSFLRNSPFQDERENGFQRVCIGQFHSLLARSRPFNQTGHLALRAKWIYSTFQNSIPWIFGNYLIYYPVGGSGEGPLNVQRHR
jgi:hypothetical protein